MFHLPMTSNDRMGETSENKGAKGATRQGTNPTASNAAAPAAPQNAAWQHDSVTLRNEVVILW